MLEFLTGDDWMTVREFEGFLRETSRLTKICQNEEKLNGACGPVMRKYLHDGLLRATMLLINNEQWGSDEDMIHPTRSEVNVNSFTKTGYFFKKRALLEYERGFFDNKEETNFVERNAEFYVNLSDRERATLFLDKRFCWSRSVFEKVIE